MAKPQLDIAYLRNYESGNCDIRFCLTLNTMSGESVIKELSVFCKNTDSLAILKKNIQEKLLELSSEKIDPSDKVPCEEVLYDLPNSVSEIEVAFLNSDNKPYGEDKTLQDFNLLKVEKRLKVLKTTFQIIQNAPLVKVVRLPLSICANFPVEPIVFKSHNLDKEASKFIWSKSADKVMWTKIGEGFSYNVQESDVGHFLKFCCVPYTNMKLKGPIVECVSDSKVEVISEFPQCPFEKRHALTQQKLKGNKLRIVSYNILADRYVDNIQFDYCPPKALGIHYRKQLIIKELEGFNPDIICLQEVDESQFKQFYKQALHDRGYKSIFNRKGNCIPEGLVCAFKASRFSVLESKQLVLRGSVERRQFKGVLDLLNSNIDVKNEFLKQNTSLQTTILQDKHTKKIAIVGNTHLFYHPDADHIRLLQAFMTTCHLGYLKNRMMREHRTENVGVIFCGDFNSDVSKSLLDFMVAGTIDPEHKDCLKISPSGDATIFHKLRLVSASGTPKFTNYTSDFKGCLDYIFVDSLKFSVIRSIPVPSPRELEQYVGLPNEFYPSDHLSLVVDIEFQAR